MKEAFGNSAITIIVITFMAVLILILTASSSYSKAAKVRNRIIEMIEENQGYGVNGNGLLQINEFREEIDAELAKFGYRINTYLDSDCPTKIGRDPETGVITQISDINTRLGLNNKYQYCVYEYRTVKGVYYGVEAYMFFDIPFVDNLKIGIYGETKTLYDLTEF